MPTVSRAETSSWFFWSDDKPKAETKAPKSTKPAVDVQPQPAATDTQAAPEKSAATNSKTSMPTSVPITGDNAAYLAFDQGQYLTALKLSEADAAKGEPQAHTLIARMYAEGLGVKHDDATAVTWYRRAADLGDIPGTFALGLMMAEGRGVAKDRLAAGKLFEKAALTGHAEANYNLGLLFLKGDGKPENPVRGAQHILYAAEKGIAQAQYDIAALYQSGTGVDPSAEEAARWLAKASAQGLAVAEFEYAIVLLKGFGLTRDEPRAVHLLTSAARKGLAGAQNRLAYLNLEGKLLPGNPVDAIMWRTIARQNGLKDETLDATLAKLPKADRDKGARAAAEWLDRSQVQPGF